MYKVLLLLFLAIPEMAYTQNLELYGVVDGYSESQDKKIYYTTGQKKFSSKTFITCDVDGIYSFRMSISEIKKSKIECLFFAPDTNQDVHSENACLHKINVGEIVRAPEFSSLKIITLRTDLLLYRNCSSGIYYDAEAEGKGKFTGNYRFALNDTVRVITLQNMWFMCSSELSKNTQEHMNKETGGWSYNNGTQILTITFSLQTNEKYGLIIRNGCSYKFYVSETSEGMVFQSQGQSGVLTRL